MKISEKTLGYRIRHARKSLRMSQSEFASLLGISTVYMGMLERNERVPSPKLLVSICEATRKPLHWLEHGTIPENTPSESELQESEDALSADTASESVAADFSVPLLLSCLIIFTDHTKESIAKRLNISTVAVESLLQSKTNSVSPEMVPLLASLSTDLPVWIATSEMMKIKNLSIHEKFLSFIVRIKQILVEYFWNASPEVRLSFSGEITDHQTCAVFSATDMVTKSTWRFVYLFPLARYTMKDYDAYSALPLVTSFESDLYQTITQNISATTYDEKIIFISTEQSSIIAFDCFVREKKLMGSHELIGIDLRNDAVRDHIHVFDGNAKNRLLWDKAEAASL